MLHTCQVLVDCSIQLLLVTCTFGAHTSCSGFMFISVSGDRGRSKKWKDMLKLPPVANTLCLRDEIGKWLLLSVLSSSIPLDISFSLFSEHTFEHLIEQQPIGKRLFLDFCATNLNLSRSMQFLTAVEELDIVVEGKKITTARQIFEDFISMEASLNFLLSFSHSFFLFLSSLSLKQGWSVLQRNTHEKFKNN